MSKVQEARNIWQSEGTAAVMRATKRAATKPLLQDSRIDRIARRYSEKKLRKRMRTECSIEDVLATTEEYRGVGQYKRISMRQVPEEYGSFVEYLSTFDPSTIVEIGTYRGGSLYGWSRCIESAETIVSIDLPNWPYGHSPGKKLFFRSFAPSKDIRFVTGNSHSEETRKTLERKTNGADVDFLFIDGDHTYEGVKRDFERYRDLLSDDGLIALHDICPRPKKPRIQVNEFWDELRDEYETKEFVRGHWTDADGERVEVGIGVVFP